MSRRVSLRLSLGFAFAMTAFVTSLVLGLVTVLTISADARANLRAELGHIAQVAALEVDADAHSKLQTEADMNAPAYLKYRSTFRAILKSDPDLRYMYTFRPTPDGKIIFVVDSGDPGPDFSPLGSEVDDVSPIMERVLKAPYGVQVEDEFYADKFGNWLSGYAPILKADGSLEAAVGVDIAADRVNEIERRYVYLIGSIALGVALLGVIGGIFISRGISKPLMILASDMEKIQNLVLQNVDIASGIKEVQVMKNSLDNMKKGLRSFKKYVPADIVTELMSLQKEAVLETSKRSITVFFSDLENFTSVSEKVGVENIATMLGSYFDTMTSILQKHHATVDKYIGDSIMAFWGAPLPNEDHAASACAAALECRKALDTLQAQWKANNIPAMNTRIGLNSGEAVIGNIGYAERLAYTALGDTVNLASRLESLNKHYGTYLLAGESTMKAVWGRFTSRLVDRVAVKGKTQAIGIYELLGEAAFDAPATKPEGAFAFYEEGLSAYFESRWDDAIRLFEKAMSLKKDDGPSRLMIERCKRFKAVPPLADWNGVTVMQDK